MNVLQRLAHARALDRLQPREAAAPVEVAPSRPITDPGAPFERREVVISLVPARASMASGGGGGGSGRPALLGACLDRLALPTHLALARDLVCLGAARGGRPVFIDTETTGLGGVALPFMVGVAWYARDSLTVTQWTLSRLSGEAELLADLLATLRTLGPDPLVSFNGASFDLPLLRVRARRHGLEDRVLHGLDHVDLLHPARRVQSGFSPNCKLSTLERDLLGLRRRGDIESAEIPAVFWASLQSPADPHAQRQLQAVREHNVVDLASLPALAARLGVALRDPQNLERARRAARHFAKLGAHEQARSSLARWVEPGLARAKEPELAHGWLAHGWREAALELAELERRVGARERAAQLWRAAWHQDPGCPLGSDAWAKHLEHHAHDFAEALRVARASRLPCERRIARLQSKLARAQAVAEGMPAGSRAGERGSSAAAAMQAGSSDAARQDPPPAPSPRVRLGARDERPLPRSELLSVVDEDTGARRRYRLLR